MPTLDEIGALAVAWHQAKRVFDTAFDDVEQRKRRSYEVERVACQRSARKLETALTEHAAQAQATAPALNPRERGAWAFAQGHRAPNDDTTFIAAINALHGTRIEDTAGHQARIKAMKEWHSGWTQAMLCAAEAELEGQLA